MRCFVMFCFGQVSSLIILWFYRVDSTIYWQRWKHQHDKCRYAIRQEKDDAPCTMTQNDRNEIRHMKVKLKFACVIYNTYKTKSLQIWLARIGMTWLMTHVKTSSTNSTSKRSKKLYPIGSQRHRQQILSEFLLEGWHRSTRLHFIVRDLNGVNPFLCWWGSDREGGGDDCLFELNV